MSSGSIEQVFKKMKSLSEIETTAKRASKAAGFSWGESEEIGKCIRQLEMFGLPGIKHLNSYFNDKDKNTYESLRLIKESNFSSTKVFSDNLYKLFHSSSLKLSLFSIKLISRFLELLGNSMFKKLE